MEINLIYKGSGLVSTFCAGGSARQTHPSAWEGIAGVSFLCHCSEAEHTCRAGNCPCLGLSFVCIIYFTKCGGSNC